MMFWTDLGRLILHHCMIDGNSKTLDTQKSLKYPFTWVWIFFVDVHICPLQLTFSTHPLFIYFLFFIFFKLSRKIIEFLFCFLTKFWCAIVSQKAFIKKKKKQ
jgi:hypothetical protein